MEAWVWPRSTRARARSRPRPWAGRSAWRTRRSRRSEAAFSEAWVYGLKQDGLNRSNLAFGNVDRARCVSGGTPPDLTLSVDFFDADSGVLRGSRSVSVVAASLGLAAVELAALVTRDPKRLRARARSRGKSLALPRLRRRERRRRARFGQRATAATSRWPPRNRSETAGSVDFRAVRAVSSAPPSSPCSRLWRWAGRSGTSTVSGSSRTGRSSSRRTIPSTLRSSRSTSTRARPAPSRTSCRRRPPPSS